MAEAKVLFQIRTLPNQSGVSRHRWIGTDEAAAERFRAAEEAALREPVLMERIDYVPMIRPGDDWRGDVA